MLNKLTLSAVVVLVSLSSCAGDIRPSFDIMNESELALYNASLSFDEQIICREKVEGWHIFTGAISFREEAEDEDWRRMNFRSNPKLCLSVRQLKALEQNEKFSGDAPVFSSGISGSRYNTCSATDHSRVDFHRNRYWYDRVPTSIALRSV